MSGASRPAPFPRPWRASLNARPWALGSQHPTTPLAPMIGCIGTAPGEARSTESAGTFGGIWITRSSAHGAVVYLPVAIEGAHRFVGDVHALQGDGELSGLGLRDSRSRDAPRRAVPGCPACMALDRGRRSRDRVCGVADLRGRSQRRRRLDAGRAHRAAPPRAGRRHDPHLAPRRPPPRSRVGRTRITVRLELPASSGVRPPTRHPE